MSKETENVWEQRINKQLEGLQYGQVIVTVHDGQIVQIDRTERTRYPLTSTKEDNERTPIKEAKVTAKKHTKVANG